MNLSHVSTEMWALDSMMTDISADTSNERLFGLAAEYNAEAEGNGYTLGDNLIILMQDYRRKLRNRRDARAAGFVQS